MVIDNTLKSLHILLLLLAVHPTFGDEFCLSAAPTQPQDSASSTYRSLLPLDYQIKEGTGQEPATIQYRYWADGHDEHYVKWVRGKELHTVSASSITNYFGMEGVHSLQANLSDCPTAKNVLVLEDKNMSYRISILNVRSTTCPVCIHAPKVELNHTGDLVYEPGEDLNLRITASSEYDVSIHPSLVSLESGEFLDDSSDQWSTFYHVSESFVNASYKEYGVRLDTSRYPSSGFLNIDVIKCQQTTTPITIEMRKSIVIRPANQAGPFPPPCYLAFIQDNKWLPSITSESSVYQMCDMRYLQSLACNMVGCTAVGQGASLKLYEIQSLGRQEVNAVQAADAWSSPFYHQAYIEINYSTTSFVDTTFVCKLRIDQEAEITKNISLVYYASIEFDDYGTRLRRIGRNMVEAKCTVTGYPYAKVMFRLTRKVLKMETTGDSYTRVRTYESYMSRYLWKGNVVEDGANVIATLPRELIEEKNAKKIVITRMDCIATQSIKSHIFEIIKEMKVPHEWLID